MAGTLKSRAAWAGRLLRRSVMVLPRAVAALFLAVTGRRSAALGQLQALDAGSGPLDPGGRPVPTSLLLLPLALITVLAAFLATFDEIRVIFLYWLTDGGSIGPGTWGGPTMAGAWLVHAVLGILLLPVLVGIMLGLTGLAALLVRRLRPAGRTPTWVVPVTVLIDLASLAFLVAFVRQL